MADLRHHADKVQIAWLTRESAYNVPTATWDSTTATLLTDLADDAPHETWDDQAYGAELVRLSRTFPSQQQLTALGVTLPLAAPRAVLNVLTGSLAVTLGGVTSVQQAGLPLYRHRITPAPLDQLPSVSAVTQHQDGQQWRYGGLKGQHWRLSNAGAFLQVESPLVGAGSRELVTLAWAPLVSEPWLLWGNSAIYVCDVSAGPLVLPDDPIQTGSNLGTGALRWSGQVTGGGVEVTNALSLDRARVSSGRVGASLRPLTRQVTVMLALEINHDVGITSDETSLLGQYLSQTPMAVEWQCWTDQTSAKTATLIHPSMPTNGLHMTASDTSPWYVHPAAVGGNLQLTAESAAPPPLAPTTPMGSSLTMRGENGLNYQMTVQMVGPAPQMMQTELTDPADPTQVGYFALTDPGGTTWYYWYIGPPGFAVLNRDTQPPGVTIRQGFDLILPWVQWQRVRRSAQGNFDVLTFEGVALEHDSNPVMRLDSWNTVPAYLV